MNTHGAAGNQPFRQCVIIVAGGKGLRMGSDIPKQFMLLNGRPVLMHTIDAFYSYSADIQIVLVLPQMQRSYWQMLCERHYFSMPHLLVDGGETRFHSVKNALLAIYTQLEKTALIAIHDGVRPLVGKPLIAEMFSAAAQTGAAYPVIPVTDTIREIQDDGSSRLVDRNRFCLVQTPQVFRADLLWQAYQAEYSDAFTDDVSVVETAGCCRPTSVAGRKENIKITHLADLAIAETLIKQHGY
ncbi:MAG: 2-C-methyl-D-erythritol 4-phosphate cytidylyltransferase [Candidatus Symbiothrix sp.]|jgi:2-C-methyl-D-erythritol 4-phosphate cytidylyltransferase|nr:2-C-methyl-D-erythritol 4-phosphate cytidylyltransferase [Candidatus Symbiothrix sp.]